MQDLRECRDEIDAIKKKLEDLDDADEMVMLADGDDGSIK